MSKLFNITNKNNKTGVYPLFFGEPLGLFDSFNVTYPEILDADQEQRALFWKANEVDLSRDYYDMKNASPEIRELVNENLSFQMCGDSFANSVIQLLFLPIISNSQATSLVSYWGDTEAVHAEAYGRIIAQCYENPNEMMERIKENNVLIKRLDILQNNFNEHSVMVSKYLSGELIIGAKERKTVIRTIATLLCLEGIMFLTSFSATFAVTESTQQFNGIAKLVGLIHDDEAGSHVRNNLLFLDIIKNKMKWKEYDRMLPEIKSLLDATIDSEFEWADHLFEKVGSIVGFNAELLKKYTLYLARPLYLRLGIDYDFEIIEKSPFPWIEKFIKPDLLQVAQQEAQSGNYLVNATVDDSEYEEFDYE